MVVVSDFESILQELEDILESAVCFTWTDFEPKDGSGNVVDINYTIRPIGIRGRHYEIALFDNNGFEWYRNEFPADEKIIENFIDDLEKQDWFLAARNIKEIFPSMSTKVLNDYAEGFVFFEIVCSGLAKKD